MSTFRTYTHRRHCLVLDDDTELELDHPVEDKDSLLTHQTDDQIVVAYLVHDDDCWHPLDDCDGMGKIVGRGKYETRDHDESEMFEAFGLDRYGDRNLYFVEDQVQERWRKYLDRIDSDTWSAMIDDMGFSGTPREGTEIINKLRDELHCVIILHNPTMHDALDTAESFVIEINPDRDQIRKAAQHLIFDTDKVIDEEWGRGVDEGRIGDRDAVMLDVYDHSGLHWSISGGGMQCQWDTSTGAGVWLPDDCARIEIERRAPVYAHYLVRETRGLMRGKNNKYQLLKVRGDELEHIKFGSLWHELFNDAHDLVTQTVIETTPEQLAAGRRRAALELAQNALDEYNAWLSGDCWGCVVQRFEKQGDGSFESVEQDACWGYVGSDYAMETLRDEFFEPAVKKLKQPA